MEQINLENLSPEVIKYINALKSENSSLQKENVDLKNKVQKQEQFISNLTEMLVNDRQKMFGSSRRKKFHSFPPYKIFCHLPPKRETTIKGYL